MLDRVVDEALDVGLDHHVALPEDRAVAGAELGEDLLALVRAAPVEDDLRALAEEGLRDAAAEARRAAGDDGDLVLKLHLSSSDAHQGA